MTLPGDDFPVSLLSIERVAQTYVSYGIPTYVFLLRDSLRFLRPTLTTYGTPYVRTPREYVRLSRTYTSTRQFLPLRGREIACDLFRYGHDPLRR